MAVPRSSAMRLAAISNSGLHTFRANGIVHARMRPSRRPSSEATDASMRSIATSVSYTGRLSWFSTSVTCSPITTRQPAAS